MSAALKLVPPAAGGLMRVRTAPLIAEEAGPLNSGSKITETVMDMQLIVDYTGALARRAAKAIRDQTVVQVDDMHRHPERVACLRCAVLSSAQYRTMGATLLEILDRNNSDEHWNAEEERCSDTNMQSRLRRLAISAKSMEDIYGPWWGEVMLTCLRAESADFELISYLTRQRCAVLELHTREALAAYHLARIATPQFSRDGRPVPSISRNAAAARLAVGMASVAVGRPPAWFDHLPAPAL